MPRVALGICSMFLKICSLSSVLQALLQSSASRKTQKKKKKKASKTAENATSGETLEENEAGD